MKKEPPKPNDEELKLEMARRIMRESREVLRKLAKSSTESPANLLASVLLFHLATTN